MSKIIVCVLTWLFLSGCTLTPREITIPLYGRPGETLTFRSMSVGRFASHGTPVWSPDGVYLAVTVRQDTSWVAVIEAESLSVRRYDLDPISYRDTIIAWRGNDKLTALSGRTLYFIDLTTDEITSVETEGIYGLSYVFDPLDRDTILIGNTVQVEPRFIQYDLVRYNIITREITSITDTPDIDEYEPRISSDGKLMAHYYVTGRGSFEPGAQAASEPDLMVIFDGERHHMKIAISDTPYKMAVGPGGRRIAFVNHAQNERERSHYPLPGIYTIDITTEKRPELFFTSHVIDDGISAMTWSEATGRMVIITVYRPGFGDSILISEPILPSRFEKPS